MQGESFTVLFKVIRTAYFFEENLQNLFSGDGNPERRNRQVRIQRETRLQISVGKRRPSSPQTVQLLNLHRTVPRRSAFGFVQLHSSSNARL